MKHKTLFIVLQTLGLVLALVVLLVGLPTTSAQEPPDEVGTQTEELTQALLEQGVSSECILGVDPNGIPFVCEAVGTGEPTSSLTQQVASSSLPNETRGWETIPSVIRNDGVETFRLEVDVNGSVAKVTMNVNSFYLIPSPNESPIELRDDGLGGDKIAEDYVFTSEPIRYNTAFPMPDFYANDPTSPAGLATLSVGTVNIEELDGTIMQFLIQPEIGLLRSDIPDTTFVTLSPDIVISEHLVNARTDARWTQRNIRLLDGSMRNLTNSIYQVLPDAFDFFILFSTNKIEQIPQTSSRNFVAGTHLRVQTKYTGTGLVLYDDTARFGSDGRLLSVSVLDTQFRGIVSNIATHEIIHHWAAFISPSLGLTAEGPHYTNWSSVGSLLGGFLWIDNGDGTFARNCGEGTNGAHHAPPLDKYMMGLIDASEVAPLHVTNAPGPRDCAEVIDDYFTVTIEDIQSVHGIRTPRPANAQRNFAIGFVAESHKRLLNPTELTFYEILAEHYTKAVPPQDPDPYLGFNWVSIDRFFSEGTSWRSTIISHESYQVFLPLIVK